MAMATNTSTSELLPLEGSSSAVWKYFGFPSKDGKITVEKKKRTEVHCKICTKVLKYNCSGLTELIVHVRMSVILIHVS